ncbi:DUF6461 domain-containing protein [Streptomyces wuyuanensis]|uniref:DUF6461 domain-containing protein n=1 Tax=Streptomyces wuyuanensis TaxID=1196353 RepID=UPI003682E35E
MTEAEHGSRRRLGDWAFCVEEDGVTGSWGEPLAQLSRGTETYSVLTTEGLDVFQYWRDGECVVSCEPGMEHARPERSEPWWDRVDAAACRARRRDRRDGACGGSRTRPTRHRLTPQPSQGPGPA